MQQFLTDLETFLAPFWKQAKPYLQPTIDYFKKGTIGTAIFLLFMVAFMSWGIVWSILPMLASNLMPPIELTGEDLADLHPGQWQRYTFETDGAFPIGIQSWFEQRQYGVVTTYRSNNSYWGVYVVDDYFLYFDSEDERDLIREPETLTGRLGQISNDTLNRLDELMPDRPDTVLSLKYHEQSFAKDISSTFTTLILGAILLAKAWFFHNEAIKQKSGQSHSVAYTKIVTALQPLIKLIKQGLSWIWSKIKGLFSAGLRSAISSFIRSMQDNNGAKSSNQKNNERVITIDPSKVRRIDEDE